MGLDATVYCDCLERGRLRSAPRPEWCVYTDEYGSRAARTGSLDADIAFDRWNTDACEHTEGVLLHQWLGNIGGVAQVRGALLCGRDQFPLLLSKVLYSGTHCGDMLAVSDLPQFAAELTALHDFQVGDVEAENGVRRFERQFAELLRAAEAVSKPIAF